MGRTLDGISNAGTSSTHRQNAAARGLGPRSALLTSLVLALLLGALSALVMFPAAQHLRSLADGEQADATLRKGGACMAGRCQVHFEAQGRTVVADLPVGSGGGKSPVGARMVIRYEADDPQVVAREEDVGGGGAAVLAVMSGAGALLFLMMSVVAAILVARQRRADATPDRSPQDRQRDDVVQDGALRAPPAGLDSDRPPRPKGPGPLMVRDPDVAEGAARPQP